MRICFLIINYNGIRYLPVYLEKISNFCQRNDLMLIITDDQSTDGSIEYLQTSNYEFTINNGINHGFAANTNHGIKYALEFDTFDYFIISNNDIEISEHFFDPFKNAIFELNQKNTKLGLIGFDEIDKNRYIYYNSFDFANYDTSDINEVKHIPGFFFAISMKLIEAIGYMDEDYFMYGEDNDYYERAKKAGFKIFNTFLPVMHYSEGSSTNDKLTSWYVYRNAFLFAQKNLGVLKSIQLFLSFIYIIYNPFYRNISQSSARIKRNGFLYNNYLLIKSIKWNLNYFINNKLKK